MQTFPKIGESGPRSKVRGDKINKRDLRGNISYTEGCGCME